MIDELDGVRLNSDVSVFMILYLTKPRKTLNDVAIAIPNVLQTHRQRHSPGHVYRANRIKITRQKQSSDVLRDPRGRKTESAGRAEEFKYPAAIAGGKPFRAKNPRFNESIISA